VAARGSADRSRELEERDPDAPSPLPERRQLLRQLPVRLHHPRQAGGSRPARRPRRRLRPAELVALEQRDIDRTGGVVYVRRQLVRGRVKQTKTRRSIRSVPLQSAAFEAIDQLPTSGSRLLFPAAHGGGHIDLHNFRPRHWRPAQTALGIDPIRRPYDLRHTYATFALRAGISIFDLSRFMGASLAMIDRHYGHLARDGRDHAVALLDAYARDSAAWTSGGRRRRTRKPARRER
jgi:integrase